MVLKRPPSQAPHKQEIVMGDQYDNMKQILEAAIFASGEPVTAEKLTHLFPEQDRPNKKTVKKYLVEIAESYYDRGVELVEVGSGYRFQSKSDYAEYLQRLWERKPPRYSRALFETLALIVYRQPITRGEIEDVRGVAVSTNIIKILLEREWVKVVGHKDVPGKPALFGTTKQFLDYFNLKNLGEMPPLRDLINLDELEKKLGEQLALDVGGKLQQSNENDANINSVEEMIAENNQNEDEQETKTEVADSLAVDEEPTEELGKA